MGVQGVTGPGGVIPVQPTLARTPHLEDRHQADQSSSAPVVSERGKQGSAKQVERVEPTQPVVSARTGTRIHVDKATDRIVAQILGENREVIAQNPPDDILRTAAKLRELQGLLFDQEA